MNIKIISFIDFAFCFCVHSFSQERISRDADGCVWLMTDTITDVMHYVKNNGNSIEVTARKDLVNEIEKLDSLIMRNQYDLWSGRDGCKDYEPYASVVYSILFSDKMKIVEIRLLRREAYEKNPVIDNAVIQSIKKTKDVWKKCKQTKGNTIFVSKTRVVVPLYLKPNSL